MKLGACFASPWLSGIIPCFERAGSRRFARKRARAAAGGRCTACMRRSDVVDLFARDATGSRSPAIPVHRSVQAPRRRRGGRCTACKRRWSTVGGGCTARPRFHGKTRGWLHRVQSPPRDRGGSVVHSPSPFDRRRSAERRPALILPRVPACAARQEIRAAMSGVVEGPFSERRGSSSRARRRASRRRGPSTIPRPSFARSSR